MRKWLFLLMVLLLIGPGVLPRGFVSSAQACRSISLNLCAGRIQKPIPFHGNARALLISSISTYEEKKSTSLSTASSLLDLLGGKQSALSVDPSLARKILSCLRFLVPPLQEAYHQSFHGFVQHPGESFFGEEDFLLWLFKSSSSKESKTVESLVQWPPPAVADLARKAVEWNGDSSIILKSLTDESYRVPDVDGSNEHSCQLTKNIHGRRFIKEELNLYMAFLFETISALAPSLGFNITLNRFDLFHGHLFLARKTGRLGILFHAREYPAYNEKTFPIHLGYCQIGSSLCYDESMNLRNILWLAPMPDCSSKHCAEEKSWLASGSLVVLDAHPDGIIYNELIPDYVDDVRTIYEDDFGDAVVDINYFPSISDNLEKRLFIC